METKTLALPAYAKLAFILISVSLVMVMLYIGQDILSPLLIALLFAILLQPVVTFLTKKLKFPNQIAAIVAVFLFMAIITLVIFFVSWQISGITDDWVKIKYNFSVHYEHFRHWVRERYHISYVKQQGYINQAKDDTFNGSGEFMGNTLTSFTDALMSAVLIPIYTFLILIYRDLFIRFLSKVVQSENQAALIKGLIQAKTVIQAYVVGLLLEMAIVATLTTAGLMLLGVEYALLLGVITAILNIVPYIGILAAGIISILATLGNSSDVSMIIGIVTVNAAVQLIDNNFIVPKVIGNKVSINALATMVGVIIGGAAWGISGMVLSIPFTAILKVIFDHIESLKPWGDLLGNINHSAPAFPFTKLIIKPVGKAD
jgi:predicted PurR-regulated permease PerM